MTSSWRKILGVLGLCVAIVDASGHACFGEEEVILEVEAGAIARDQVPIAFDLPAAWKSQPSYRLVRIDNQQVIPTQSPIHQPSRLVWMLEQPLAAGERRRYRLQLNREEAVVDGQPALAKESAGKISLLVDSLPVLDYQRDRMPSADPNQPYFARSGFIHPVFDPSRRILTDAMPPDHMHQHGIMFAWVKTNWQGRAIDFWNSKKQEGEIRQAALSHVASGPVFAAFQAELEHLDHTSNDRSQVVLREIWEVRVYRRTGSFLFDLRSEQQAVKSPLTILEHHYGGLCVRGNSAWLERDQSDFLTSHGKTRADGNHTRPHWVDLWGKLDGSPSGLASFCHPDNFRAPQPVRLHPTKPYCCWSPCVLGDFTILPDRPYISQYRFLSHSGKLSVAEGEAVWKDYAQPVKVTIVPALRAIDEARP
jgi:hypothetical protein